MSALTTFLERHGAELGIVDGVTTALGFGDSAGEYTRLRDHAGLVDYAWWGRLHVTGSDRVSFLQGMLSNDVKQLAAGTGRPALLLSEQGKTVAELVVLATADATVLVGNAAALANARIALERFVVADDVEIAADEDETRALAVLGPEAGSVLERLGAAPPSSSYDHGVADVGGAAVAIVRVPSPGAGGWVLHVPAVSVTPTWTALVDAGASPVGFRALDVLRIESGVPWYGRDVSADTLALEAPYEAAISFRKGCYLGQEVMERVTARGHVNRKLVGLALAGDVVPPSETRVFASDRDVGWVTSAARSWRLGYVVALAYVRREHLAPGTALVVGAAPGILATVRDLPF